MDVLTHSENKPANFAIRATLWDEALKSYSRSNGRVSIPYESTLPDSPWVEMIWHGVAEDDGLPQCAADSLWYLRLLKRDGKLSLTVHGPTTKATPVPYHRGDKFLGIRFKPGVFMPHLPLVSLVDRTVRFQVTATGMIWFGNSRWEAPAYENADTFVKRLVRENTLAYDPIIGAVLRGQSHELSLRAVQLRFLRATGLSHKIILQIERARYAAALLKQGLSGMDVVCEAGYFDQPHLTRSLKRFLAQTPSQIAL